MKLKYENQNLYLNNMSVWSVVQKGKGGNSSKRPIYECSDGFHAYSKGVTSSTNKQKMKIMDELWSVQHSFQYHITRTHKNNMYGCYQILGNFIVLEKLQNYIGIIYNRSSEYNNSIRLSCWNAHLINRMSRIMMGHILLQYIVHLSSSFNLLDKSTTN